MPQAQENTINWASDPATLTARLQRRPTVIGRPTTGCSTATEAGGGRQPVTAHGPELMAALLGLVEPNARGDPMSPLRWTTKSLRHLANELTAQGHPVSAPTVGRLLR